MSAARSHPSVSSQIESASLRAWPAMHEELVGPWLVRTSDGFTKRRNSASLTMADGGSPVTSINACEAHFRSNDLPPIFRIPSFLEHENVEAELDARGYETVDETLVLTFDLQGYRAQTGSVIQQLPIEEWIATHSRLLHATYSDAPRHEKLVRSIRETCLFAVLSSGEVRIASGLGVVTESYFGLFDIVVAPDHRGEGRGRELLDGMLTWGSEYGATIAYLQVVSANASARALYSRSGFQAQYEYSYRVKRGQIPAEG